jgi:hypothetical protein
MKMSDEFHVIKEQTTRELWQLPGAPATADARRRRTIMITDSCGADFRSLALLLFFSFSSFLCSRALLSIKVTLMTMDMPKKLKGNRLRRP